VKILHSPTRQVAVLLLAGAVLASSACGGSGDKTQLRAMNANPARIRKSTSRSIATALASNVAYGTASDYSSVGSGSHTLLVYPPGVATPYIDDTISLTSGDKYTVVSANVLSNANALLLIDETPPRLRTPPS
jgi:hypothetical protein